MIGLAIRAGGKDMDARHSPGMAIQGEPVDIRTALCQGESIMSRIFISGSSTGLGLMAAGLLERQGHAVGNLEFARVVRHWKSHWSQS